MNGRMIVTVALRDGRLVTGEIIGFTVGRAEGPGPNRAGSGPRAAGVTSRERSLMQLRNLVEDVGWVSREIVAELDDTWTATERDADPDGTAVEGEA